MSAPGRAARLACPRGGRTSCGPQSARTPSPRSLPPRRGAPAGERGDHEQRRGRAVAARYLARPGRTSVIRTREKRGDFHHVPMPCRRRPAPRECSAIPPRSALRWWREPTRRRAPRSGRPRGASARWPCFDAVRIGGSERQLISGLWILSMGFPLKDGLGRGIYPRCVASCSGG